MHQNRAGNNCSTLKKLSLLSYQKLKRYDIMSYKGVAKLANPQGDTSEAMKGNLNSDKESIILRVDASKIMIWSYDQVS